MTGPQRAGRAPRWGSVRLIGFAVLGAALLLTGIVLLSTRDDHGPAGAALGAGTISLGACFATLAKFRLPPPEQEEERHAPGSPACAGCHDPLSTTTRRGLLAGGSVVAIAGVVGGGALIHGSTDARRALASTPWDEGDALVTSQGRPLLAGDLEPGALVTVWPEHAVGAADAQAVLLRIDTRRLGADPRVEELVADGHVAYSKLCTHMGCPIGLFQQDPDVLVCPCHQAVFDVLDGARPVQGPARRPLPQLPLMIGADGVIRAAGGFTAAVGPGWWGRPR